MAAAPHTLQAPADAPRKPHVLGAWLAYNPDETLAQFFARKKDALAAGDQAWRDGKIKAHHQKLYERLVDAVGAHQYSWIKVETLADEFKADESTIKRWLTVLEKQAKLIRRQRQFKTSSRTYLVAYDQHQAEHRVSDEEAAHGVDAAPAPPPTVPEEDAAATVADEHAPQLDATSDAQAADAQAVFFERTDAPTYSALVRPEVKDLPLNTLSDSGSFVGVNGGKDTFDITIVGPGVRSIIDHEGVTTDRGQAIVAARPTEELRAVQGYLDHQTNVRDRSGLFVWLNERAFGAELLAGRARTTDERQPAVPAAPSTQQRRRQRGRPAPPAHRATRAAEHDPRCTACGHISAYLGLDDAFCEQCGVQPGDELGKHDGLTPDPALWQTILAQLDIAPAHRDVWLAPTMLAHYGDLLVLACPHKLVGESIHTRYRAQIDAATSAVLGRPARVEITVKYMPDVTEAQRAAWLHGAVQPIYPAWLHDDTQAVPPHSGCDDDQQQRVSRSEVAAPHEEACTPSPHMLKDQDADTLPALLYADQENITETCIPLPTPSIQEVWTSVCNAVALPPNERQIWLEPTALLALGEDDATISAPNIFVRNRIATHYYDQLASTLSAVVGRPLRITVVTDSSGARSRR